VKAEAQVDITPAMMAQAFWEMCSDEQAEFFTELSRVIREDHTNGNTSAYSRGELQWFHLGDRLMTPLKDRKPCESYLTEAGHMLQTMAAPLFLHTLRAAEQASGW
jgi:hypothetical protein